MVIAFKKRLILILTILLANNSLFSQNFLSTTDFTKIESPRYPDREPCYHSLAYGQFTAEEMSNGYAWKVLNES